MRTPALLLLALAAPLAAAQTTLTYPPTDEDFLNPERGFHSNTDLVSETDLSWVRPAGYTLTRAYVRLDAYRDAPLPAAFLDSLDTALGVVREGGVKVVLRFAYNFGGDGEDAPLDRILEHIGQLAPVFEANADVIAVVPAGFIGAWGEWHSSTNGNDTPEGRAAVHAALLDALPPERQVQLRYPSDLVELYPDPLDPADASSGSDQARTGHHNDCFLSNEHDAGTYLPADQADAFRTWLDGTTPFVFVGGETCQVTPDQQRTDCPTALAELTRFHWTYLNDSFWAGALDRWRAEGCYGEIRRRLGHRLRLVSGTFPERVAAGRSLQAALVVANDGFAGLRNPRAVELVLTPVGGGEPVRLPADLGADPRLALPGGGGTATVTASTDLPDDLPLGDYALGLALPDPAAALRGRPEYAVRLANADTWDAATGVNSLGATVAVAAPVSNAPLPAPPPVPIAVYPNPARTSARVTFVLAEADPVRLDVLDALGRPAAALADGPRAAGEHALSVPLAGLPAGAYLIRLRTTAGTVTARLSVAR